LLLYKWNVQEIVNGHHAEFINSITYDNYQYKLDFVGNPQYRDLIGDFVGKNLDNVVFIKLLYLILDVIRKTFEDHEFLSDIWTDNTKERRYDILKQKISEKIKLITQEEGYATIQNDLKLVLFIISLENVKQNIVSVFQDITIMNILINYKDTIVCILKNILTKKMLHEQTVKNELVQYIKTMDYMVFKHIPYIRLLNGCAKTTLISFFNERIIKANERITKAFQSVTTNLSGIIGTSNTGRTNSKKNNEE
jgi:hypothetical protein